MEWPLCLGLSFANYLGGVVVESDFGGVVEPLVDPDVVDLEPEDPVVEPEELDVDPEVPEEELVELLEAVLEALAGAVGVVPAGVVNIGTRG